MKKLIVSAILFLTVSSAFAERPCRAWRGHGRHRHCVRR